VNGVGLFKRKQVVFEQEGILVGEFDPTEPSLFRNVVHIHINVKPKRLLYLHARSDRPVDVAVFNQTGNPIRHLDGITDGTLGPISTETWTEMSFVLGVFRGDKATADVEVWTEKK
jgi:hypothetical protein